MDVYDDLSYCIASGVIVLLRPGIASGPLMLDRRAWSSPWGV